MGAIKQIRGAFGGTVNDVVLTAITGAFRDLLIARGDPVEGVEVHTLVPVSVRVADDATPNNQVATMIATLPVGIADPVERLHTVREHLGDLKASHEVDASTAFNELAGWTPPALHALALAVGHRRHAPVAAAQRAHGDDERPRSPVPAVPRKLGHEMLEYLPYVPLSQGVRIGVAILSYNGQLRFGVTGDYDTVPETEWIATRIEAAVSELVGCAELVNRRDDSSGAGRLTCPCCGGERHRPLYRAAT